MISQFVEQYPTGRICYAQTSFPELETATEVHRIDLVGKYSWGLQRGTGGPLAYHTEAPLLWGFNAPRTCLYTKDLPVADLTHYTDNLTRLKLASSTVGGVKREALYKPALLLAVLEGVEDGSIYGNQIRITPGLIAAFKAYCRLLSPGPEYAACPFHMPFFHLPGSGCWHLQSRPGQQFDGRKRQLPKERKWWPKPANLTAQREAGPW